MSTDRADVIAWEADLPLLSGRILRQWTIALMATGVAFSVLLGTIFAAQREWDLLLPMLTAIGATVGGLWLFGLLVMVVVFRGRYRVRYTVSDRGIRCETIERAARAANRIAVVAGAIGGRPGLAGAGMAALGRETEEASWTGGFRTEIDERRHGIAINGSWRTLLWVQCTPENFAAVSSKVAEQMAAHQTGSRASQRSPLRRHLGRTLLVVASSVPLLAASARFGTSLLVPIVTLCFAAATVWLVNLFGWVVLLGLLLQAAQLLLTQLELRTSFFDGGRTFRAYEVLRGDDAALLAVAGLGAAAIAWLSIRALRGRWLAALVDDRREMGA
jgi:hypothetical protein